MAAALEIIEQGGKETLSLRAVARRLGLAPNALYNYFPDRRRLEAALAAEGIRRLHAALKRAIQGRPDAQAVQRSCRAYLRFARRRPALYATTMKAHPDTPALLAARTSLRDFFRGLFRGLEDPRTVQTAGFAAWALLHGTAVQERDELLDGTDPQAGSRSAMDALIAALSRPGPH